MRTVCALWPGTNTAQTLRTATGGIKETTQDMARHKLTLQAQLKGVEKALASRRCPPQLKEGLRRRADELRNMLGRKRNIEGSGLFGLFRR